VRSVETYFKSQIFQQKFNTFKVRESFKLNLIFSTLVSIFLDFTGRKVKEFALICSNILVI
jgi:hypothetical protein